MRRVNKEKLQELQEKIKQWSKDRGITINGKSTTQMLKLVAEISEIFEAYLESHNNTQKAFEMLKDAIGDSLVVIINLTELIKKEAKENDVDLKDADLRWCNAEKHIDSDNLTFELIVLLGNLSDAIAKSNYSEAITLLNELLRYLNFIAEKDELNLDDCLEFAYNEIKDRKGFLNENGNFIKTEDPNYEKLYNEFLKRQND